MEKKPKKKMNNKQISDSITNMKEIEENDTIVEEISEVVATSRKKRINKRPLVEDSTLDEVVPQLEKKKEKFKKPKSKVLNKKIIFKDNDEEPCEVTNNVEPEKKNKAKPLNEDEADVKEEDIDKFCDEISDKDNEQYEDWVKLIEAKLHSNKKSK